MSTKLECPCGGMADAPASNPGSTAECRFKSYQGYQCRCGGIGRHAALRMQFPKGSGGSSPLIGTKHGRVAERLNAPVSKTGVCHSTVGSNPTPSSRTASSGVISCGWTDLAPQQGP